jgi:hypothetical protein
MDSGRPMALPPDVTPCSVVVRKYIEYLDPPGLLHWVSLDQKYPRDEYTGCCCFKFCVLLLFNIRLSFGHEKSLDEGSFWSPNGSLNGQSTAYAN